MKKITTWLGLITASILLMSGCSQNVENSTNSAQEENTVIEETVKTADEKIIETTNEKKDLDTDLLVESNEVESIEMSIEERMAAVDLSKNPNELGKIMVLMYHHIAEPEAEWSRTPENFRSDLETLYNEGYRTISLNDYVNNNITIEAGFTPVVITFDDGNQNNFNILGMKDGKAEIDPNCAVAIMEKFKNEHPDFGNSATFFLYGENPFGQDEYTDYKLNYLVDNGFEVGNHTQSHNDLKAAKNQNADKLQRAIGKQVNRLESRIEKEDYKVNTIALPFGHRPKTDELVKYVEAGSFEGNEYENIAILNVGWDPYYSPVDLKFDASAIHRVRAGVIKVDNVGILDWIESFRKHPERKFISDGEADIVTIPSKFQDKLDKEKVTGKALNIYESN